LFVGRAIPLAAGWFVFQLGMGIVLVHAENGWFVVGGGRNGVEYSVVLILGFVALIVSERWRR
jgi:putative oxidoreductase